MPSNISNPDDNLGGVGSRDQSRVINGPLTYIMKAAYIKGAMAGLGAIGFAFGTDYLLRTPVSAPRFGTYARIPPQHRFYGWTLFCLGVFQFNVEDTEVNHIKERNANYLADAHQEELDHIKAMEAKKAKAMSTTNNSPAQSNAALQQQKNAL